MRKHLLRLFIATTILSGLLTACSKDKDEKKDGKESAAIQIDLKNIVNAPRVVDLYGAPLAGAKVLIGRALNEPLADNYVETAADGSFKMPSHWTQPEIVTIEAKGYIRASFLGQTPKAQVFKLRPVVGQATLELSGLTSGFSIVNKDGVADFAIVMPALQKQSLFSFDTRMVISPLNDTIKVYGQEVQIPTNVSIPKQKETYILPVTLEKPEYRLWFAQPGPQKVVTLKGQFPFKEVVDALRGNVEFVELINKFNIQGGSFKEIQISGAKTRADLSVSELSFKNERRLLSPDFKNDEVLMAVTVAHEQGAMIPTDVKNLEPQKIHSLKTLNPDGDVLTVLKRKSETQNSNLKDRLSATLMPFTDGVRPELYALLDDPGLQSRHLLKVPALSGNTPSQVTNSGTYSTVSSVKITRAGNVVTEDIQLLWEIYSNAWEPEISLPEWPEGSFSAPLLRWGVTLLGSQNISDPTSLEVGPALLDNATHATHSSIDFK